MTAPEVLEVRALAREFAQAQLRPHAEAWDAAGGMDDGVVQQLAELGFFGMLVAEADGGMGFGREAWVAALEELAWGEPAAALLVAQSVIAADFIARYGDDAQRARWLGGLAAGELLGCIAFSAHPDPARAARAEPAGEGWTLHGRKSWVTNGDRADLVIVLVEGGAEPALFAVPRDAGIRTGARASTLGMRAVPHVDLELDGVSVDAEHRLAGFGGGAAPDEALGALSGAAIAVGIARAALEHAVRYSGEREQFGVPIRSFEGIRHKLAEMATRTAAARALVQHAAAADAGAADAAMAKLMAAETAMHVTTEAVQVFGGYGYMRDYPVEKLMRDAKATQIMHGPSEVQRLRIADSLHV
jgi:alkylation response protein AidB-like acyl-CoA dehydrogenase